MSARLLVLLRRLINPGIYAGALVTAILVVLAYQARPSYDIQVGTPTDGPMLVGFNGQEKMQGSDTPFRWSSDDSYIILQDVGRQDFVITLTLSGNRPPGQPPANLRVETGRDVLLDTQPRPDLSDYELTVSREQVRDGTLTLHLLTNGFSPPGDPRTLGVVVTRIQASPGPNPDRFIEPPLGVLAVLVAASAIFGLLLSLLGWGTGGVLLGETLVGGLAASLLIWDRLWLTSASWYNAWPQSLLYASVFTILVWLIGTWLLRQRWSVIGSRSSAFQFRLLLTIILIAFTVRLAGQLHPEIYVVDFLYHVHRFQDVQNGTLIIMHPDSEFGGQATFYLPTTYLFMMPLQWLVGDIPTAVRLFTIALSTLGAFVLYYLCSVALRNVRAGLFAAVLYLTLPLAVLIFSWGLTTNIFADFISLLIFTVLVVAPDLNPRRPAFWLLSGLLIVGVLSHAGVLFNLSLAILLTCVAWAIGAMRGWDASPFGWRAAWLGSAFALAAIVSYLIYYVNVLPGMIQTLGAIGNAQNGQGGVHLLVGGAVNDRSLGLIVRYVDNWGDWFWGGLQGLWNEFWAYFKTWPLVGALIGLVSLPRSQSAVPISKFQFPSGNRRGTWNLELGNWNSSRRLYLVVLAWAASAVVFAVVGWRLNLYVRYSLFALPVVVLGMGLLLARLWERGRWAIALALLVIAFFVLSAFVLWQYRINYGLK